MYMLTVSGTKGLERHQLATLSCSPTIMMIIFRRYIFYRFYRIGSRVDPEAIDDRLVSLSNALFLALQIRRLLDWSHDLHREHVVASRS